MVLLTDCDGYGWLILSMWVSHVVESSERSTFRLRGQVTSRLVWDFLLFIGPFWGLEFVLPKNSWFFWPWFTLDHLVPRLTGSGAWIPAPNNKGLKTEKLNYCSKSKSEIVYFFRIVDCFRSIFSETWQLRSKSEFLFDSYFSAFSQLKHFGIIKTRENEKIGFTTTDT